jgi:hypothetical protein
VRQHILKCSVFFFHKISLDEDQIKAAILPLLQRIHEVVEVDGAEVDLHDVVAVLKKIIPLSWTSFVEMVGVAS